jgi:hypothetical protein
VFALLPYIAVYQVTEHAVEISIKARLNTGAARRSDPLWVRESEQALVPI